MNESKSLFNRVFVRHGLGLLLVVASNGGVADWSAAPALAAPPAIDGAMLRRKQDDQQRARAMARDLLTSVLDVQLRQLEENGLTEISVYRDIKVMHSNIGNLVDTEMAQVVQQLADAQDLNPEEREASFIEARQTIRNIVIRLSAERQNLLRSSNRQSWPSRSSGSSNIRPQCRNRPSVFLKNRKLFRKAWPFVLAKISGMWVVCLCNLWGHFQMSATGGAQLARAQLLELRYCQKSRWANISISREESSRCRLCSRQSSAGSGHCRAADLLRVIERTQGLLDSREQQTIEKVRELLAAEKALRIRWPNLIKASQFPRKS